MDDSPARKQYTTNVNISDKAFADSKGLLYKEV
jgi:hypothetical protein